MTDGTDPIPWTIKGVSHEARSAGTQAAKRERQSIGEWVSRAIIAAVSADQKRGSALVVVPPIELARQPVPVPVLIGSMNDVERVVAAAAEMSRAAGEPPPKAITRAAYSLIRDQIRALKRGQLSPDHSPTGLVDGQTENDIGKTAR